MIVIDIIETKPLTSQIEQKFNHDNFRAITLRFYFMK